MTWPQIAPPRLTTAGQGESQQIRFGDMGVGATLQKAIRPRLAGGLAKQLRSILDPLLVAAWAGLPGTAFLRVPVLGPDEGLLLVHPDQMAWGRLPYRDFFTLYGPGGFALLKGVYALIGDSLMSERMVGLGYRVTLALGIMAALRCFGRGPAVGGAVVSTFPLLGIAPLAYAWVGGLGLVVVSRR